MPITPLPTAPSPTNERAVFLTNAFAHVAALADFTTEANALEVNVNALEEAAQEHADDANAARIASEAAATQAAFSAGVVKWVSGTTYAQGFQVWSPANYVTYRRKVAGAGTTDPSADPTNWAPLWASPNLARDLGRARYYDAVHGATALAGGQYAVDTSLAAVTLYLPAVADTERGDRIEFINVGMSWARPYAFVIDRPASGIYIQGVDAALNLDLPMTGMALVCRSKGSGMAWWNLT